MSTTLFTPKWFPNVVSTEQCAKMTDEELLDLLKTSPDFSKFVFPTAWHKKFPDLPKADCANPKEFIAESPWMKKAYTYYDNGGKIIDIPANPDKKVVILPALEIESLTLVKNSFSDATIESETLHQPQTPSVLANSTGSNEHKIQE